MIKGILLLAVIISGQFFLLNAQEKIPAREKFNWKEFQETSIVIKDSVNYDLLQGNWISYEGRIFGDYEIAWHREEQKILEIKGDKYRKTLSGDFFPFLIDNNLIIFYKEDNKTDTAYINLITDKEFKISFKEGLDFVQYKYKK